MAKPPPLTVDQLRAEIEAGDIDTVIVAFADMQGRLQGKRLHGHYFLDHDLEALRRTPGSRHSATVQCDLTWLDGSGAVKQSPRSVLKAQVERAASLGMVAHCGTELEFIVFQESYEQAWDAGYTGLTPANRYNVDYSILGGDRVEPLLREIRNEMYGAGAVVESAKGECNYGQHEIGFLFDEAVRTCDNHVVYRNAAHESAAHHGQSLTFMAK